MNTEALVVIQRCYDQDQRNLALPPSPSGIPLSYESITPEWLTAVMCSNEPQAKVVSLSLGPPDFYESPALCTSSLNFATWPRWGKRKSARHPSIQAVRWWPMIASLLVIGPRAIWRSAARVDPAATARQLTHRNSASPPLRIVSPPSGQTRHKSIRPRYRLMPAVLVLHLVCRSGAIPGRELRDRSSRLKE
jgi:hypothetical protein